MGPRKFCNCSTCCSELQRMYQSIAVVVLQQQWSTMPQYLPFSSCRRECGVQRAEHSLPFVLHTNYSQHAWASIKHSSRMHIYAGSIYMAEEAEEKTTNFIYVIKMVFFSLIWLWRFNWQLMPVAKEMTQKRKREESSEKMTRDEQMFAEWFIVDLAPIFVCSCDLFLTVTLPITFERSAWMNLMYNNYYRFCCVAAVVVVVCSLSENKRTLLRNPVRKITTFWQLNKPPHNHVTAPRTRSNLSWDF